ncbi:hypothetical protein OU994_25115 [Pseudoduganella sp. SL102]|uniref:DRBM domain-containing protein n=1 Tax=Pseudoduganella albidiflava TaxID=321983 RepID=A0A411WVB0_9BURK|nr:MULTISPECIES: hypothetical protein [Pseudoduganella]QBI00417.1 hypothetical protein EYF70_05800 [Pseudoduganella albidiflava]WBS01523.1 hypothetical protein OU994_25115 [Pseudoduganella sp. SL102]GGY53742.1 hypothetical protein GCM10007387_40260 [Pseudoduganella albidiflava]
MEFDYQGYTIRTEEYEDTAAVHDHQWHCTIIIKGHVDTWSDRFTAEQRFASRADAEAGAARIAREYLDKKLAGSGQGNPQV